MKKLVLIFILYSISASAQIKLEHIKSLSGNSSTDQLTNIVALGDINKDGYNDFALEYYVKSDSSYAKVYFGGVPFDSTKTIVFSNPKPKFYYRNIYGGGDINGDGYNDFIVSYYDNTSYHNPSQYELQIHFGGGSISVLPEFTIVEIAVRNCLITSDFNGDGIKDIILTRLVESQYGKIVIYLGKKTLKRESDFEFGGTLDMYEFGKTMTVLGDVNKDGCDDFIISTKIGLESYPSTTFLFFGGDSLGFKNSLKFTDMHFYGVMLNALGDINGDGYKDFFIAGVKRDIFLGDKQIDPQKHFYRSNYWLFNGIGDINKDGYDDYIKFLNEYKEIHLGSRQVDTISDAVMNYTGDKYVNLGDVNGDGRIEIANNDYYSNKKVNLYSVSIETLVEENEQLPTEYHFSQNFPNPFNPETTISYSIPKSEHVTLKVYDLLGREVATLVDEYKQAGNYNVKFNVETRHGASLPSGVYFYRLQAGNYTKTQKMILMK
ncbi:MAG: T9SS type A sorting domain-containing protein [Melioribacteraceae bacterium]